MDPATQWSDPRKGGKEKRSGWLKTPENFSHSQGFSAEPGASNNITSGRPITPTGAANRVARTQL